MAALAFIGLLVLDVLTQFTDIQHRAELAVDNAVNVVKLEERKLIHDYDDRGGGLLRRLVSSLLPDYDEEEETSVVPSHRSYNEMAFKDEEEDFSKLSHFVSTDDFMKKETDEDVGIAYARTEQQGEIQRQQVKIQQKQDEIQQQQEQVIQPIKKARSLRTLPLLPKHALQHRQRRELISSRQPIPPHLRDGYDDKGYNSHHVLRRRMYPHPRNSARHLQEAADQRYEIGAIYQGYGTHYLDLWVGTPPQRQTVIIDTGSSATAFPCSGCKDCGSQSNREAHHLDEEYDTRKSGTYEQSECTRQENGNRIRSLVGNRSGRGQCPLGTCTAYANEASPHCHLAVSYAEGSSWTAVEGSDVVYPAGGHEKGAGMADLSDEEEFDWTDFRLHFGCQSKVTGLFKTQLEDGITGMDNRAGSFWLQLHQHYTDHGFVHTPEDAFDSKQFALCFDRQPLSLDLQAGVGSGALTLGGSDPLLHLTDMVYAANVTPKVGWYTVRITGMFLRPGGGTLSQPRDNAAAKLIQVDVTEDKLNGNKGMNSGVIIDSGTTDTYLPQDLKTPFDEAWKKALSDPSATYTNSKVKLSLEEMQNLPTILMIFKGHHSSASSSFIGSVRSHEQIVNVDSPENVIVAVPPEHYMEESRREPGKYIPRFYFTERYGAQSVLGSNFIMGHEVLFDVGGGRIGFSESHCDYDRYMLEREESAANSVVEEELNEVNADLQFKEVEVVKEAAHLAVETNEVAAEEVVETQLASPYGPQGNELTASGWSRRISEEGYVESDDIFLLPNSDH